MNPADLLTFAILLLDFVISVWDSYAAGFNLGLVRSGGRPRWLYAYSAMSFAIGIVGEAYVLSIVIGLVFYSNGFVAYSTVALLLAPNFLVLGGLLTILGVGVTIIRAYVAIRQPNVWTVGGSLWNVFASIWNVFAYVRDFGIALNLLKTQERVRVKATPRSYCWRSQPQLQPFSFRLLPTEQDMPVPRASGAGLQETRIFDSDDLNRREQPIDGGGVHLRRGK